MYCEACGADNSPAARFCSTCGAALARCPHCSQELPEAAKFCPSCGNAVPSADVASVQVTESPLTKQEVQAVLAALRHKQLIFRRECSTFVGTTEYTFKHDLLRNVTYESLLKKLRRDHHCRVAAWLIDQSGQRIGEYTALVAAHFEQAGRIA